jgi:glycosyltransferase involved in cell wall biosynthesis
VFVHRGLVPESQAWRQLWEQADLFVFPSRLETFGIVLLEALAFGVPVVSADVGAARSILADGQAGVLLRELDELSLAAGIKAALENPSLTEARIQRGQAQVKQHFDLAANAGRLAQWLHQAVGG